jgi:hypothetical protein
MPSLDIFNSDAFSLFQMTQAIEKMPTVPNYLGSMGLFGEEGVTTNVVSIEQRNNTLSLIPTSPRGTQPTMGVTDKRTIRNFSIPRIAKADQVYAAEIQGVRAFGSETELDSVARLIAQKQQKLLTDLDLTLEYHRLGAIQGKLLDSDGTTTIYNYFTEFGVAEPTEIAFDLSASSPVEGVLLNKITAAKRAAIRALGQAAPGIQFQWLCGDTFFDNFINHNDVRVTYKNWQAAESLRGPNNEPFSTFRFGGMDWTNYQGTDDNSTVAIGATKARLVIKGVPGLYRRINGPGETMETVNTVGRSLYSMLVKDNDRNMWVQPEVYAYPLHICTRPEVLLSGRAGA